MEVLRVKCGGRRRTVVADGDGGSRWREVQMQWWCWQICGGCRDWCVVVMVAADNGGSWWQLGFEENQGFCFGEEDDDVAAFHWTACQCKDCCHVACSSWPILKVEDSHMA